MQGVRTADCVGASVRCNGIASDVHRPERSGAPVTDRDAAADTLYFDTPQKCGQISVVASIPDSLGEAIL